MHNFWQSVPIHRLQMWSGIIIIIIFFFTCYKDLNKGEEMDMLRKLLEQFQNKGLRSLVSLTKSYHVRKYL